MTGLERITAKIIAEAESDAAKILEAADDRCAVISKEADEKATAAEKKIAEQTEKKCEDIISRAKSSANMTKRNILLEAESEMIDRAFETARREILNFPKEKYCEILVTFISGSLTGLIETERVNREVYGDTEELPEEEQPYEILLNVDDKAAYGNIILEELRRKVVGKIDSSVLKKVKISDETANIDGGIILRYGNIELNCSISKMINGLRATLEGEIAKVIFESEN
ncbi:MAG: V-type ATP synthase subunit E family protein [Clostridia bacterium]|nr:V-type ATP synthase subunit E family protein [Clostridia bacterium]MDY3785892.1 V-type ATP synthase subunit E family protein [Eubacteriales bacterium]